MFKTISIEIKKYLSKPGIFILSVLLALILVLGVFVYEPSERTNSVTTIKGDTVVEKYNNFYGDRATYGEKLKADTKLKDSIISVNNYFVNDLTYRQKISELNSEFGACIEDYAAMTYNSATPSTIITTKNNLVSKLDEINANITKSMENCASGSYTILSTKENFDEFQKLYKEIRAHFASSVEQSKIADHCNVFDTNYKKKFNACLSEFKFPTISKEFQTLYTVTNYEKVLGRLQEIEVKIDTLYKECLVDDTKNIPMASEMDKLAYQYINSVDIYANLIHNLLVKNAFSCVTAAESINTMYLSDLSKYNSNSLAVRYQYLFKNNKTEADFALPLTIGSSSNVTTNAYDYAYFVLRLFSFVIIVFAVMNACFAIAGEIKEGSMRYMAIRPVSRLNLYFGKLFAIIILSLILALFSGIIALMVGGAVYGFNTVDILTVFNGSTAIVIHPIVMILIFLLSMMLELIVYTSIAMFLSSLIKSDLISVTIVVTLCILNLLLPVFINDINSWLNFYPFSHINLFAMMGGTVYETSSSFFSVILGAKVYSSTSLSLTLIMIFAIIIVFNLIAYRVFKKKDL